MFNALALVGYLCVVGCNVLPYIGSHTLGGAASGGASPTLGGVPSFVLGFSTLRDPMVSSALFMISASCCKPENAVKVGYTGLLYAACVNASPNFFAASINVSSGVGSEIVS